MGIGDSLIGAVRVRIISASVEEILIQIVKKGIVLRDISCVNELTVEATLSRTRFNKLKHIVSTVNGEVDVLEYIGVAWSLLAFRKRPVFLIGILVYLIVVTFVPTRILFIQTEGNTVVPQRAILEQAYNAGIRFGSPRRAVRSERVKNALLAQLPELKWVGVNTYGCVAVIAVKERSAVSNRDELSGISSIVAKCDGIIEKIVPIRGDVLCHVGQAVIQGQMLVSGYTDCGLTIKGTAAEAEIYAITSHELDLVMPTIHKVRTKIKDKASQYSLVFGKKEIKLYKDSGILGAECVKMNQKKYLTLPGGFALPIAIVKETLIFYELEDRIKDKDLQYARACELGSAYLQENMIAGEILFESVKTFTTNELYCFHCKYFCREMIGKVYNEEIAVGDEQRS